MRQRMRSEDSENTCPYTKNAVFWGDYEECRLLGYKTQFLPHRRHITSRLENLVG
jgi:hypothetical protein